MAKNDARGSSSTIPLRTSCATSFFDASRRPKCRFSSSSPTRLPSPITRGEIRNGLSIPPQMNLRNVIQMMTHPTWSFSQLLAGAPEFKTMLPYLPKGLSMKHLGLFMNQTFSGRLNEDRIKAICDKWKGKLVVEGIVTDEDAQEGPGARSGRLHLLQPRRSPTRRWAIHDQADDRAGQEIWGPDHRHARQRPANSRGSLP